MLIPLAIIARIEHSVTFTEIQSFGHVNISVIHSMFKVMWYFKYNDSLEKRVSPVSTTVLSFSSEPTLGEQQSLFSNTEPTKGHAGKNYIMRTR